MKYYEIDSGSDNVSYCNPYLTEDNEWYNEDLRSGQCSTTKKTPIIYSVDNDNDPDDLIITGTSIMTPYKIFNIIKRYTASVIGLPSVFSLNNKIVHDEYTTLLIPQVEAFHFEKSIYSWSNIIPNYLGHIERIVLSESKLASSNYPAIFLLKEQSTHILISQELKTSLEQAKIRGAFFTEVDVI